MSHENKGYMCEKFLAKELRKLGCNVKARNLYYDFDIITPDNKEYKLELKSCKIQTISGNIRKWGRFDFKYKKNLLQLKKHNIWICLIVYINNECEVIGFIHPNKVLKLNKRFIQLEDIFKLRLISYDSFIKNKLKINLD